MGGSISVPKNVEQLVVPASGDPRLLDPRSPTHARTPIADWRSAGKGVHRSNSACFYDPRSPMPGRTPLPSCNSESKLNGERVAAIPLDLGVLEPCIEESESPVEETAPMQRGDPQPSHDADHDVLTAHTATDDVDNNGAQDIAASMEPVHFVAQTPSKRMDANNNNSSSYNNTSGFSPIFFADGDLAHMDGVDDATAAKRQATEPRKALIQLTNAKNMPASPKGSSVFVIAPRAAADKRPTSNVASLQMPLRA